MKRKTLLGAFVLMAIYWRLLSAAAVIDGTQFKQDLHHLAHDILGLQEFQTHVDQQRYVESALDGSTLVSTLALSLENKFRDRMAVVKKLQESIETMYKSTGHEASLDNCCVVSRDETDERFGREKINLNAICTSGTGATPSSTFLSQAILDVMKSNLEENPLIKWQYFGSEEGLIATYPASAFCSSTFDPRLRPWYIETATPEPKDVVLVLDTSGSMGSSEPSGGTRLSIAVRAANTVIDTLNSNDRIGVVAFSDSVELPPGTTKTSTCYKRQLARAIPKNKKYLSDFVKYLNTGSDTEYILAMNAAFDYFLDSVTLDNESKKRHRVILFLTDGDPTDDLKRDGILNTLRDKNAMLQNTVVILTFGIGDITQNGESILRDMANQVYQNKSVGEARAGQYTKVSDLDNLRYVMASFYNFFRPGQIPAPTFTVPYIDAFGIGLVMSACLPVSSPSKLQGVTCLDMAVGDLLGDLTYFRQGEISYAFLTDDEGLLLMHPLLPGPQEANDNPVYVLLTTVERDKDAEGVMDSMMRGDSGNVSMTSLRVTAKGDVDLAGVQWNTLMANYYWKKIADTEFSLCVAIGHGDKQTSLADTNTFPATFTYHRLDLKEPSNPCRHFARFSLKDRSSVKFTGDAFVAPFDYQDLMETKLDAEKYTKYMTGGSNNPGFKAGIRNTVAMTTKLDTILLDKKAYEYGVWFYIGTVDGTYRVFPGVQLPKMYNHKLRSWYKKTAGNKGLLTISTPYKDAFGAGLVVTLGRVIFEARIQHKPDDPSIGVMAMDFPMSYVYNLLETRFPLCAQTGFSCFLLDKSGFIVAHKDFFLTEQLSEVENIHITVKEPYIAQDLIAENMMKRSRCMNLELFRYQHFWTVTIPGGTQSRIKQDYEIYEVEGSNIFVVIRKYTDNKPSTCFCKTFKGMTSLGECSESTNEQFCQCPCHSTHQYNYCTGDLDLSFDDPPPCSPPLPNIDFEEVRRGEHDIEELQDCFDYKCQDKTTQGDCTAVVACVWCQDNPEDDPFCTSKDECSDGEPTTTSPDDAEGTTDRNPPDTGMIVGVVIGVLVLAILVSVGIIILKRKGIICGKANQPTIHYNPSYSNSNNSQTAIDHLE